MGKHCSWLRFHPEKDIERSVWNDDTTVGQLERRKVWKVNRWRCIVAWWKENKSLSTLLILAQCVGPWSWRPLVQTNFPLRKWNQRHHLTTLNTTRKATWSNTSCKVNRWNGPWRQSSRLCSRLNVSFLLQRHQRPTYSFRKWIQGSFQVNRNSWAIKVWNIPNIFQPYGQVRCTENKRRREASHSIRRAADQWWYDKIRW